MLRYVFRRLLTAIPTLFVIVTISFFLIRVAPGGPFNQERGLNPVIKANLGEQVSLSRTSAGSLRVEALVEGENRKAQILGALAPVMNNPAVRVEVSTVSEAARRQQGAARSADTTVREVEVADLPRSSESDSCAAGPQVPWLRREVDR